MQSITKTKKNRIRSDGPHIVYQTKKRSLIETTATPHEALAIGWERPLQELSTSAGRKRNNH